MSPARALSLSAHGQFREVRIPPGPGIGQSERRQHRRYPIIAKSEYVMAGNRAPATTLDISSGGVFLKTDKNLPLGNPIQVFIDWPMLLDQRCPLRLLISGRVLRSDARGTVVGILSYDFRLRPRGSAHFAA